jgi:predicted house-cleaning noncanonical NTP pyrophosphatase (MazG superfamily)
MENKMPNDTLDYLSDKSEHDLMVILEGFKMLLADAELFDMLAEKLDLSDNLLVELREDVNNFMEDVV